MISICGYLVAVGRIIGINIWIYDCGNENNCSDMLGMSIMIFPQFQGNVMQGNAYSVHFLKILCENTD